uniref:Serine/threonine protein kinase n=1 Tax=Knipowitschia caucasica TaxID=637954 RepID=A0AAV2KW74_KNICA
MPVVGERPSRRASVEAPRQRRVFRLNDWMHPTPANTLRNLVDMCINPDPEKRPDITYVYDIAKHMMSLTQG